MLQNAAASGNHSAPSEVGFKALEGRLSEVGFFSVCFCASIQIIAIYVLSGLYFLLFVFPLVLALLDISSKYHRCKSSEYDCGIHTLVGILRRFFSLLPPLLLSVRIIWEAVRLTSSPLCFFRIDSVAEQWFELVCACRCFPNWTSSSVSWVADNSIPFTLLMNTPRIIYITTYLLLVLFWYRSVLYCIRIHWKGWNHTSCDQSSSFWNEKTPSHLCY